MLNTKFILSMIKRQVNSNNEISEEAFLELVDGLEDAEINEVLDILSKNNINVTEDTSYNVVAYGDYNNLLKLTNEELCVMYQRGDSFALDALCIKNERLVHSIAGKTMRSYRPEVLEEEDLFIVGNIGLQTAAEKFIAEMGNKFSTYACYWIRQAISREIMNNGFRVRLPVHVFEQVRLVHRCRCELPEGSLLDIKNRLANEYGKFYSIEQVEKLVWYGENYLNTYSLNKIIDEDGKSEMIDFIPCEYNVEDEVADGFMHDYIEKVLSCLSERESKVIRLRFGLGTNNPMTLDAVGKTMGVTRERIRQIEAKAIRKLGRSSSARILEDMYAA